MPEFEKDPETGEVTVSFEEKPKDAAPKSVPPSRHRPLTRVPPLEDRLNEFFGKAIAQDDQGRTYYDGIAGLASMLDPFDAALIAGHAPTMAKAWSDLADESERVRRFLEMLLTGGAWGGVIVATMPVAIGILANHNMLPGNFLGQQEQPQEEHGDAVPSAAAGETPGTEPRDPRG